MPVSRPVDLCRCRPCHGTLHLGGGCTETAEELPAPGRFSEPAGCTPDLVGGGDNPDSTIRSTVWRADRQAAGRQHQIGQADA